MDAADVLDDVEAKVLDSERPAALFGKVSELIDKKHDDVMAKKRELEAKIAEYMKMTPNEQVELSRMAQDFKKK